MNTNIYAWTVELFDANGTVIGTRRYVGTEDEAIAKVRRTRVGAYDATFSRKAIIRDGVRVAFRAHEMMTFALSIA